MFFYTHTWSHPVFHAGMGKPTFPAFQFVKLNPQRFCLPFTPANQVSFPLRSHSFPVEYRGPAKTATSTLNPSTSATTMSYNSHTKSTTGGKPDLKKCLAKAIRSQVSEHCGVGTPNTHRHTYTHTHTHTNTHTHTHTQRHTHIVPPIKQIIFCVTIEDLYWNVVELELEYEIICCRIVIPFNTVIWTIAVLWLCGGWTFGGTMVLSHTRCGVWIRCSNKQMRILNFDVFPALLCWPNPVHPLYELKGLKGSFCIYITFFGPTSIFVLKIQIAS
jgi:hypothetical protein